MHRIYFDTNDGDEQGRWDLGIYGSLRDIEPIASDFHEGMKVQLYDDGEFELEAILEWNETGKRWMGRPVPGTWKRIEEG